MKRHRFAGILLTSALLLLCGCNDLRQAGQESQRLDTNLHAAMSRGDWQGIYANADPGYRESVTAEKSQTLFSTVVRKLGAPTSSKETGWNINATTSGTFKGSVRYPVRAERIGCGNHCLAQIR